MSDLNESIVEDAAVGWFKELGYAVGHRPHMAPGEPAAERDSCCDVVLVGRLRATIARLNPAIPEEASACALHGDRLATIRPYRIVRLERRLNP
jgi:type I restriction enzyme, R subunit